MSALKLFKEANLRYELTWQYLITLLHSPTDAAPQFLPTKKLVDIRTIAFYKPSRGKRCRFRVSLPILAHASLLLKTKKFPSPKVERIYKNLTLTT